MNPRSVLISDKSDRSASFTVNQSQRRRMRLRWAVERRHW